MGKYKEYMKKWEKENRKRRTEYKNMKNQENVKKYGRTRTPAQAEKAKEYRKRIRLNFIEMYGSECVCCGEKNIGFLTIEHKLGQRGRADGKREVSTNAYKNALKEYNPDIYEILCFNCNCGKNTNNGVCPHKGTEK